MSSSFAHSRLSELMALLCDELISDEQFAELDQILDSSAEARRWYRVYLGMNRDLEQSTGELSAAPEPSGEVTPAAIVKETPRSQRRWRAGLALVASVLIVVGVVWLNGSNQPTELAECLATITYLSDDVEWSSEADAHSLNDLVGCGQLQLESGLVRLQYRHGVVVSLIGPVSLDIQSEAYSVLHYGELAAYVPAGAEGFQVDTPTAKVIDLGTEFGVTVDQRGDTELSVFDGEVEVEPAMLPSESQVIVAGHAVRVDRSGRCKSYALAPYKRARDSLRKWQVIWEPFGPGSATGPFPGSEGAGWRGPWSVDTGDALAIEKQSGIFSDRPLYPGTEYYLSLAARPKNEQQQVQVAATREFGPIDQFTTQKPYSIELLVRIESNPRNMKSFRVFSRPEGAEADSEVAWQIEAIRQMPDDDVSWSIPTGNEEEGNESLAVLAWQTVRCYIEVDPVGQTYLPTVASFSRSIRSEVPVPLTNNSNGPMTLGFEAVGKDGTRVRYSVDGIRIQSLPLPDWSNGDIDVAAESHM